MTEPALDLRSVLAWLQGELGAKQITSHEVVKLSGGAIQENWRLVVKITGGPYDGEHELVLRTDAPSSVAVSHMRWQEFRLLQVAFSMGIPVPEPVCCCADASVTGRPFFIMKSVAGEARGRRLTRDPRRDETGPALVAQLGRIMARLHTLKCDAARQPGHPLSFLPRYKGSAAAYQIKQMRGNLDQLGAARPVLEYGLNWLEDNLPDGDGGSDLVLCHRDFRVGNFLVDEGRCTALLDWEFAGWSDRHEDIGWLCARCWRFGIDHLPVGGLGPFSAFRQAYETESGEQLNLNAIGFWQVMAEIRWAVIALQQAARNDSGQELSLELSLSGYLVPEMEFNMLSLIDEIDTGRWQELNPS